MINRKFEWIYHLMLIPGMIFLLIFSFIPMFGVVIASEIHSNPRHFSFQMGRAR